MKIDNLIEKIIEKINKPKSQFSFDAQRMFQEYLSDLQSIQSEQQEMIDAFEELLKESLNNYSALPNSFRMTAEECYSEEIKLLEKITGKKFDEEPNLQQPKEENQKSLLEQARDKYQYQLNYLADRKVAEIGWVNIMSLKEIVDLYEQYAKEAEEKISDLKRLREKYFKEVGKLKLQRQQFLKYTRNEIRKLKDENKQLKQNKIEIEIEAEEKIKEQNELLNGLKEACFNCKQAKLSEKLQQEIEQIKQSKIEILKTINDLLLDEDYLNEHGKGYNQALKDILEQLTKAGLIK